MTDRGRVELELTCVRWNLHFFCSVNNSAITQVFFAVPSHCSPSSSRWPILDPILRQSSSSVYQIHQLRTWQLAKTIDIESIKFDFPAPLNPIAEVKFIYGPIVWWPLCWKRLGEPYATWKSLNPPVGLEVAYYSIRTSVIAPLKRHINWVQWWWSLIEEGKWLAIHLWTAEPIWLIEKETRQMGVEIHWNRTEVEELVPKSRGELKLNWVSSFTLTRNYVIWLLLAPDYAWLLTKSAAAK